MSTYVPEMYGSAGNARSQWVRRVLLIAGLVLLAFWAAIWTISLRKNYLVLGQYTRIPCFPYLSCDFDINYYATRTWIAGGDPYQSYRKGLGQFEGGFTHKYDHPPLVLALFTWCLPVSHQSAVILWFIVQTAVFSLAVVTCWRSRNNLDLFRVPLPLLLAAFLFSFPVLFELERGNWNMLVLLFLLLTVMALRGRSRWCDFLAGAFAGIATWIKIYPALLLLGLLALRRWRAAGSFAVVVLLIGLCDIQGALEFAENIKESARFSTPDYEGGFISCSHTVSGSWLLLCRNAHLNWLGHLPGAAGWGLLVFPVVLWVSYWVSRVPEPSRLIYPYFLWLMASATYLPPIANDYSLFFLPLAALAVWDCRDRAILHVLMVFLLIWWQPITPPLSNKDLYYCKLVSLVSVALLLVVRAWEQIKVGHQDERIGCFAPAP
ncbi:MAG TPA: glycosyltransferase 87 family protein [Gemmataceae bacterium]|nr:glycosyltransferase 87 family protein [Gemmataceae bacterium]